MILPVDPWNLEQEREKLNQLVKKFQQTHGTQTVTTTIPKISGSGSGVKHDSDKLRVDLLPVDVLEGIASILTHGAKKYGDRNWEGGIHFSRLYAATLRHLFAFWRGEDVDHESGLLHLDHALCELAFLSAMARRRKDLDDRPEGGKK